MGYQPQGMYTVPNGHQLMHKEPSTAEIADLVDTVLSLKNPKASLQSEFSRRGAAKFPIAGGVYQDLDETGFKELGNYKFAEMLWYNLNGVSSTGKYSRTILHDLMSETAKYMRGNSS